MKSHRKTDRVHWKYLPFVHVHKIKHSNDNYTKSIWQYIILNFYQKIKHYIIIIVHNVHNITWTIGVNFAILLPQHNYILYKYKY